MVEQSLIIKPNGADHDDPRKPVINLTGSLAGYSLVLDTDKITRRFVREQRRIQLEAAEAGKSISTESITIETFESIDGFTGKLLALYMPLVESSKLPHPTDGEVSVWVDDWPYDRINDLFNQLQEKVKEFVDGPKKQMSDSSSTASSATESMVS